MSEENADGKRRFAERLQSVTEQCPECGFTGTILGSAWKTETHTDPKSGHVLYQLTCPDCNETTTIEVNLP